MEKGNDDGMKCVERKKTMALMWKKCARMRVIIGIQELRELYCLRGWDKRIFHAVDEMKGCGKCSMATARIACMKCVLSIFCFMADIFSLHVVLGLAIERLNIIHTGDCGTACNETGAVFRNKSAVVAPREAPIACTPV